MNIKINRKHFLALSIVLLLPCLGVSKCNPSEQLAEEMALEQTREAQVATEVALTLNAPTPELPTLTSGPLPTVTQAPQPQAELPEDVTWEDLAGLQLPVPPTGKVTDLSTCESTKKVQVQDLSERDYQTYKENIQDSGWEMADELPEFDPQARDVAVYNMNEEVIQLDYDRQKAELILQRGALLGAAETLYIMGGRQWGDVMAIVVPAPAAGRMINFSEVSNGEQITARRVILEGLSAEILQKWLADIGNSGWAEQIPEFQEIFQNQLEKNCGPAFDPASEVISPASESTTIYFLDSQTNAMIELTYNDNQLVLTWLTI